MQTQARNRTLDEAEHLRQVPQNPVTDTNGESSDAHDELLVQRMANGDQVAAARLFDNWSARLHGYAHAMVRESADADEVVGDALAAAWNRAGRFDRSRGTVGAWLTTLVRSRALDLIRSRSRRHRAHERVGAELLGDLAGTSREHTWEPAPLQGVVQDELCHALAQALTTLPLTQREVIELTFLHGVPHTCVARQLGVPLGTVKTRARSGLRALRLVLQASRIT